ncbi:D(2)-like dopamine receptor, partial [Paramuricea clavata]
MLKSTQLRKGTCNFMIFVLSSFDLLVVVFGHPSVILSAVPWSTGDNSSAHWSTPGNDGYHLAEVGIIVSNYTQGFSILALLTMTIDRYLALTRPLFHKVSVTRRRLLALTVTMQLLLIVIRMFRFFKYFKAAVYYAAAFLFGTTCMLLLVVMNCRMFSIAVWVKRNSQAPKTHLALLKKSCTCLLAVGCFFVCITPVIVYALLRATSAAQENTLMLIRLWGNTSLSMSSTLNCVIFFWRNEMLRKEGMKLLCTCPKLRR